MGSERIKLPKPKYNSTTSIEETLLKRRSIRKYKDEPLKLEDVAQLLWAAQGITEPIDGLRTAPSAGALYPLELYIVINNVEGISKGVYKYNLYEHKLVKHNDKDVRDELMIAALEQEYVRDCALVIVISAIYKRTTWKYGARGIKYVYMEAGHVAQNIYLQTVSLNLGTVVVGAFDDERVRSILNMLDEEHPLCIMPVGKL